MEGKLGRGVAGACGLALLLALGACGRSHEGGADRAARNQTGTSAARSESSNDAAVRAAVQRAGSTQGS